MYTRPLLGTPQGRPIIHGQGAGSFSKPFSKLTDCCWNQDVGMFDYLYQWIDRTHMGLHIDIHNLV